MTTDHNNLAAHPQELCMMAAAILGQPEDTADNRHPYWPLAVKQAERAYVALATLQQQQQQQEAAPAVAEPATPPAGERLTEIATPIAEAIAKNAGVAPQLVFPHLYLGLKDLFAALAAQPEPAAQEVLAADFRKQLDELSQRNYALRMENASLRDAQPAAQDKEDAARDVLAERERQKSVEGWTPEHDDSHRHGDMSTAAACYAMMGRYHYPMPGSPPPQWPWDAEWWKPTTYRRNLVKAGALVLAEIERLDRAVTKPQGGA